MAAWPIDWHANNLKNFRDHVAIKQAEADRMNGELIRIHKELEWRQIQIDNALRLGKKEFDPEKFMKKQRHRDRE